MAKAANYMSEPEAASLLGLKPKTLRVYVYNEKKQKEPFKFIRYKKLNRDTVIYSRTDIEMILNF